jgi:dTDP-4-amino-4,6-dideoxygalactose transaminase
MFVDFNQAANHEDVQKDLEVFQDGWLAPGNKCELLESNVAGKCQKKYGIVINNRKSAVLLTLIALRANADSFLLMIKNLLHF